MSNNFKIIDNMTVKELKQECKNYGIKGYSKLRRNEILTLIKETINKQQLKIVTDDIKKEENLFCYPVIIDIIYSYNIAVVETEAKLKRYNIIMEAREKRNVHRLLSNNRHLIFYDNYSAHDTFYLFKCDPVKLNKHFPQYTKEYLNEVCVFNLNNKLAASNLNELSSLKRDDLEAWCKMMEIKGSSKYSSSSLRDFCVSTYNEIMEGM